MQLQKDPIGHRALLVAAPWFVGIVAMSAWLRLSGLGDHSIWYDEGISWWQANRPIPDMILLTANDNYPPLHNLLLHAMIALFGDAEWSLRLPSALLGIGVVGLGFLTGYELKGLRVAVVAALLLAFSPIGVWYAQEARMYALLEFGSIAFAWSVLRYLRRPDTQAAVVTAVAGLILLYSHLFGSFVWIGIAVAAWLALRGTGRPLNRFLRAQGFVIGGFAPWAVILLLRSVAVAHSGFWIPPIDQARSVILVSGLSGGPPALLILLAGVALCLLSTRSAQASAAERSAIRLLALWLAVPVLFVVAISLAVVSLFLDRYLIGIVPAAILLAAMGFDGLFDHIARLVANARPSFAGWTHRGAWAGSLIVAAAILACWQVYPRAWWYEDWRNAARYIEGAMAPGDCVVLVGRPSAWLLHYYRRDDGACFIVARTIDDLKLSTPPPPALFVVGSHVPRIDDKLVKDLTDRGWRFDLRAFPGIRIWRLTRS